MNLRINSFEQYQHDYLKSISNPELFWDEIASEFQWKKKWTNTLQWNFEEPKIEWFKDGKLNITENLLDRHLEKNGNKIAFHWEANNPDEKSKSITYQELYREVCKLSNGLKSLGVQKGDRICIYMPMIIESVVAILACARIGAVHSIIFAGFSSNALADRINDAQAKIILTSDGLNRADKKVDLKEMVDSALESCSSVEHVIVFDCIHSQPNMLKNRDIDYHELIKNQSVHCEAEEMDAEDMLFILYTSGSTGKPKGVVHTCAGYMVYVAYSFQNVFQYKENDIFWCTADIGWITGHSYAVYGPLLSGATSVLFEGVPTYPDAGRFWQIIDKFKVTQFYTAPTAIRSLMTFDERLIEKQDLSSLQLIGSVGEPINEEAWNWFFQKIGKSNCPLIDTWWQTETGGILISPIAGVTPLKPAFATLPLPGVQPVLMDTEGNEIEGNDVEGNLCIKFPWPGMSRSLYGDHERFRQTYYNTYQNYYFTGDGARRDAEGYYRITGRVDDVINVSGHRIGTGEVEDAINGHASVVESAVVGYQHDIKGQGIFAFVIITQHEENLVQQIKDIVSKIIGPFARPEKIIIVPGLPKTRSGKIMRRILRKIAEGDVSNLGDTSTLLDPGVVEEIKRLAGL